mmetsp:Transcript_6670/g.30135  ORF Transcript_6670/g.30135 Transcript_6670/m.30135 type:complete len:233 (+) Transcript_6670:1079-1777(+)
MLCSRERYPRCPRTTSRALTRKPRRCRRRRERRMKSGMSLTIRLNSADTPALATRNARTITGSNRAVAMSRRARRVSCCTCWSTDSTATDALWRRISGTCTTPCGTRRGTTRSAITSWTWRRVRCCPATRWFHRRTPRGAGRATWTTVSCRWSSPSSRPELEIASLGSCTPSVSPAAGPDTSTVYRSWTWGRADGRTACACAGDRARTRCVCFPRVSFRRRLSLSRSRRAEP